MFKQTEMSENQFAADFLASLQMLRCERLFCDAVLTTEDGRGEIWAHRVVLATASARLCSTLSSEMKSTVDGPRQEQRIRLPGCDLRAVEVVVSYLYSGRLVMPASFAEPDVFNKVLEVCGLLEVDVEKLNGQSVTFLPDDSLPDAPDNSGIVAWQEEAVHTWPDESHHAVQPVVVAVDESIEKSGAPHVTQPHQSKENLQPMYVKYYEFVGN